MPRKPFTNGEHDPRAILVEIAQLVRSMRKAAGLSIKDLAAAAGLTAAAVRRIENAQAPRITLAVFLRLARAMDQRFAIRLEPISATEIAIKRRTIRSAILAENQRRMALLADFDALPDDVIEGAWACFGCEEAAEWLTQREHLSLGGISVWEAARTPKGLAAIKSVIGAIEHNSFL